MFGYEVQPTNDPCVAAADEVGHLVGPLCLPGGTLLNVVPVLRHIPTWLPFTSTMQTIERAKALTERMIQIPMDKLKEEMVNNLKYIRILLFFNGVRRQRAPSLHL